MIVNCGNCNKEIVKSTGHYNWAIKLGMGFYCDHKCHQATRKTSLEAKRAIKKAYDKEYSKTEKRKATAKAYNESPAGRAMQKRQRAKKKEYHNEYCRRPEYRANKVHYDRERQAKLKYGEFWECAILTEQINKILVEKADKAELRTIQGTNNKSKRRKKQWLRLMKNLPQLT